MNNLITKSFATSIKNLDENSFQDFIDFLFLEYYGVNDYQPIKDKRDRGCDGIIKSKKCIIACYAPEIYNIKAFRKKSSSDYKSYYENWGNKYENWQFITNNEIHASEKQEIGALGENCDIVGIKQLVAMISELKYYQIRRVGEYLKIDPEFFSRDILLEIIEDLLKDSEDQNLIKYQGLIFIDDKIKINVSGAEYLIVKDEYEMFVEYFGVIDDILGNYSQYEINLVKSKIINDYRSIEGNFKSRLEVLTKIYGEKYYMSDDYIFFIRAIIFKFFEQCLIGIKVKAEYD